MNDQTEHGFGTKPEAEANLLEAWERYCETRQPAFVPRGRNAAKEREAWRHEATNRLVSAACTVAWHLKNAQQPIDLDTAAAASPQAMDELASLRRYAVDSAQKLAAEREKQADAVALNSAGLDLIASMSEAVEYMRAAGATSLAKRWEECISNANREMEQARRARSHWL